MRAGANHGRSTAAAASGVAATAKKMPNLQEITLQKNYYHNRIIGDNIISCREKCRRFRSGSGAACVTLPATLPSFHVAALSALPPRRVFETFLTVRAYVLLLGFTKKGPSHRGDDDRTIIPYLHR